MPLQDVGVREMVSTDVAAVASIEKACAVSPWSYDLFMGEFSLPADSRYWLIVETKVGIVGFAGVMFAADEATILNVGVSPSWRRRGIAQRLLHDLLETEAAQSVRHVF